MTELVQNKRVHSDSEDSQAEWIEIMNNRKKANLNNNNCTNENDLMSSGITSILNQENNTNTTETEIEQSPIRVIIQ